MAIPGLSDLARATGLEPATTGSTVRYSNQLSYAPELARFRCAYLRERGIMSRRRNNGCGHRITKETVCPLSLSEK
jgi:hypothetical protein